MKNDQAHLPLKLKEPVPEMKVNEGSDLLPIELTDYIEYAGEEALEFDFTLVGEGELPKGILFGQDGLICGTPRADTARTDIYQISVTAHVDQYEPLVFPITLVIEPAEIPDIELPEVTPEEEEKIRHEYEDVVKKFEDLKDFWRLFSEKLELPDLESALTRDVSSLDIYHLLGRFATLVIWNADDLTPADEGKMIQLPDASDRYEVYDFDVALVATPKDLYDSKRTLENGIETARAMVKEIQNRKWNIELAGYDKLVTAAWVAVNQLNQLSKEHQIEVYNYAPSRQDYEVLSHQATPAA